MALREDETHEILFWRQIDENPNTGCWEWQGARSVDGYGKITFRGSHWRAHRLAYALEIGPIPDDLQLDHLCRVRHCVNPAHLEAVTCAENISRGLTGTPNREKTHCVHGHEYTPENTIKRGDWRQCRTCHSNSRKRNPNDV